MQTCFLPLWVRKLMNNLNNIVYHYTAFQWLTKKLQIDIWKKLHVISVCKNMQNAYIQKYLYTKGYNKVHRLKR